MDRLSDEGRAWWSKQRWHYNIGLVVAGISAFACYVIVVGIFHERLRDAEITIFTTLIQGIGYLFMMGIANLFYQLGPCAESICTPKNPDRFRRNLFRFGFWFSVMLPFTIPGLLLILLITIPVLD